MKKNTAILLVIVFAAVLISACAAEDSASPAMLEPENNMIIMQAPEADAPAPADMPMDDSYLRGGYDMTVDPASGTASNPNTVLMITPVSENLAEKIIHSYYANIETLEFDETLAKINELLAASGGFVEQSDISGIDFSSQFRDTVRLRSAYYVIRIPSDQLNTAVARLGELGNIINQSSSAQNVTAQFTDTQSRLNALRTQEERLLDMLANANDLEILLALESSLADVRYQIEWLTSNLNNMQRQVDYSTLTLQISEVIEERDTERPTVPEEQGYWARMGEGLISSLKSVGDFFAAVLMWIVVNAPVLLVFAAIGIGLYFIIRRSMRRARERANERQANMPYPHPYYQQQPQQYYPQGPEPQPEPQQEQEQEPQLQETGKENTEE